MLFFIRKLIEALLLPFGVSAVLIVAAVFLRRRWLALAGVVILVIFSSGPVSILLLRPLEQVYPPMTVGDAPHVDAIVVLSGGILRGKSAAGVQWDKSSNRFFSGIDLALARKANLLIISTGVAPRQGLTLRQVAIRGGVAADRITLTPLVSTTEAEARAVADIPGIHSILLVTSAFHMPRAVLLFRDRGFDVTPFPTDERVLKPAVVRATDLIPDPAATENSEAALREYYGLAVYRTLLLFHAHPAPAAAKNPGNGR